MRMDGKAVLVTGGASGIGEAIARRVTAEGGRVAVLDLLRERAEDVAAELPGGVGVGADVSDEDAVIAAVDEAAGRLGGLHGVVNAAGHHDSGDVESTTLDSWNRLLAVHATGTFLVCRAAVPHLRRAVDGGLTAI